MTQLWDPLWEYVLEDYDSDEETRLGTWRRRRQQKQLQRHLKRQNLREQREREKQIQRQLNNKKNKKKRKNNDDSLYASGSGSGGGALVSWDSWVSSKDGQDDVESTSNLLDQRNDESYDYDDIDDEDQRSVDDDDDDDDDDEDDDDETTSHKDLLPSLDFAAFPNFFTNVTTDNSRQEQEQEQKQVQEQKQKQDQKEEDQRASDLERNQQPRGNKSFWRRGSSQSQSKSNESSSNINDNFNNDNSSFWNIDFFDVRDDNNEEKRSPAAESTLDSITPKVALHTPPPSNTKPKKGILRRTSTSTETGAGAGAAKEHPAISSSQRSIDTTGSTVTNATSNSNNKRIHNLSRTFAQTFETNEDDDVPFDVSYDDENDEDSNDDIEIVGARTYMTGQFKPFGRKRVNGDGTKRNYKVKSGGPTESPSQKASTSTMPSPSPAPSNIEHGIQKSNSNSFNRRRLLSLRKNSSTKIQGTVSNDDVEGQKDESTGDRSFSNLKSTPRGIPVLKSSDNTRSHLDPVSSRSTSREIQTDDPQNANTVNSNNLGDNNVQQKKKKQFLLRRQFRKATIAMRLGRSRSQNKNVASTALDQVTMTPDGNDKLVSSKTDALARSSDAHQPQVGTKAVTPEDDTHSKSQAISDDGIDVDDFDPLMMFLEVAEKLDPWGDGSSDEDSGSDTTASELAEQSATTDKDILSSPSFDEDSISQDLQDNSRNRHRTRSKQLDSLLDQKLPIVTNQATTEIRLRVNPVGDTLSEEIVRSVNNEYDFSATESVNSSSDGENKADILAGSSQISEDNLSGDDVSKADQSFATSISVSRSSVQEEFGRRPSLSETTISKVSALGTESATHQLEDSDTLMRRDNAIVRKKFPSDELKIPLDLKLERPIVVDSSRSDDAAVMGAVTDNTKSTQRGVFRRLACWKEAKMDEVEIRSKMKTDSVQGSSAKKNITEKQPQMIPKSATDLVNGIGAFSQEHAHRRGPHSLYSYDHDSTAHMDACYEEFGQRGRESVSVRRLADPPISTEGSVVIRIEASTISETDCIIRHGSWWGRDSVPLPNTPGVDVVGKIIEMDKAMKGMYDFQPGDSVLSLVKWGGNSRYISLMPNQLIKVQDGLDPAEVACIPETYLSAFQVLHIGQKGNRRYKENSLKGKTVLIIGAMSNNMGMAIIELALHAEVACIYATAKKKHWNKLVSHGVMPLSQDPMDWIKRVEGTVDLVLAPNGTYREDVAPIHFRALRPNHGQLVLCGRRVVGNDIPIQDWKQDQYQTILSCSKNKALTRILNKSHSYDVYEEWEHNRDLCKKDVQHLLRLLMMGIITPKVLDRIELEKVGKAHEVIESKRLPGFLVCEPWMNSKHRAVYL